ncbi:MAG: group II intron reverse transcriptase/maturase [Ferruginibacter sp.]
MLVLNLNKNIFRKPNNQLERVQTCTRLFFIDTLCFSTSPNRKIADNYRDIDWKQCNVDLRHKQAKILWAFREKNDKKVLELQQALVRSFAARAISVRKVVTNDGKNTPGVDGITWKTDAEKLQAIHDLKNLTNYKASPVKRVSIPKPDGSLRPLGIPTMRDRAVQALWYLALIPIAEETADPRSYGFRPHRGPHDCVTYLNLVLSSYTATRRFVLDADIKKFFDNVSHDWILENIPMDKTILEQFLKAGFIDSESFSETSKGFPQGGIISPTIGNMVLDGLKTELGEEFLITRYADDFVILGKTRESLKTDALIKVNKFLNERGLVLNLNKTTISSIEEGFEFLGFLFKEYPDFNRVKGTKKGILLIKPSPDKTKKFRAKLSEVVKKHKHGHITLLINELNPILRGWSEYYRVSTASRTFNSISKHLFVIIWKLLKTRYRKVPRREIVRRHFCQVGNFKWVFYGAPLSLAGNTKVMDKVTLFQINYVKIKRHMLCSDLNSYDPKNYEYFEKRVKRKTLSEFSLKQIHERLYLAQSGKCPVCTRPLLENNEPLEIHHIVPRASGGSDNFKNLLLLHKECHHQVTNTKSKKLQAAFRDSSIIN